MAHYISNELIDDIRQQVNIVDVIGQYVQLSHKGKSYMGLCPFQEEKTPSFSVSEEKQLYHCFSCGRAGNIFKFVMDIENISFKEAVVHVAQSANIAIPDSLTHEDESDTNNSRLKKMYQEASVFYSHILTATKTGNDPLRYLTDRQISVEAISKFGLGFAPNANNILLEYLRQQNFSAEELLESGLFVQNDSGELFDRFRDRVMFPLKDQSGRVVAFSGRKLRSDSDEPKYLNSPETKIFTKSKLLFNFDLAKIGLKEFPSLVLYEGYMDVISADQAGFHTGIASMGTSLTDEQIYAIKRVTNKLTIAYDGDQPGQKATARALNLLDEKQFGIEIGVVSLPEKLDPDEFIKKYGAEKFQNELAGAITPLEFKLKLLQGNYNLENDRDKLSFSTEAVKLLAEESSPVARDLYLNQIAQLLEVSTDALKAQLIHYQRINRQVKRRSDQKNGNSCLNNFYGDEPPAINDDPGFINSVPKPVTASSKAEERLLFLQLRYEEVRAYLLEKDFHFQDESFEKISNLWQNFIATHDIINVSSFLDYVPENLKSIIVNVEMANFPEEYTIAEIDDYLVLFANERVRSQLSNLKQELESAKRKHDQDAELLLTQQIITLQRKLKL